MQYIKKQTPRISDFNKNGEISLEAIVMLCEECSSSHASEVQENILGMSLGGTAWVATEWAIQLCGGHPNYGDTLLCKTWTHGLQATMLCEREYSIQDETGKPYYNASIKTVMVDLKDGKMRRLSKELCEAYQPEDFYNIEIKKLPKLREPESWDEELKVHLRKSDMDFNGHVHNTHYFSIANEILPEDTEKNAKFVRIIYRKGVTGAKVTLKRKTEDSQTLVGVYNENGEFCSILSYE